MGALGGVRWGRLARPGEAAGQVVHERVQTRHEGTAPAPAAPPSAELSVGCRSSTLHGPPSFPGAVSAPDPRRRQPARQVAAKLPGVLTNNLTQIFVSFCFYKPTLSGGRGGRGASAQRCSHCNAQLAGHFSIPCVCPLKWRNPKCKCWWVDCPYPIWLTNLLFMKRACECIICKGKIPFTISVGRH